MGMKKAAGLRTSGHLPRASCPTSQFQVGAMSNR